MAIPTFSIKLKWAKMIAPQVRHLAFETENTQPFSFSPGQFVTIHFEHEGKSLRRSYSLATSPKKSSFIEMAVGHFEGGPGTNLLFGLNEGDTVTASGPFGKLVLPNESPKRYVFVATSTGVTPFRTMIPELEDRMQTQGLKVVLLQGVQRREDLLYGEEFIDLASKCDNFDFRAHYSREAEINASHEYKGYVQHAFPSLQLDPNSDVVYLCGNPQMIDQALTLLKDQGFDTKNVRREKYISSK